MKIFLKKFVNRWVLSGLLAIMLLAINTAPVQASFSGIRMLVTLWRVEKEILQATPAGQYLEGIAWLHATEGFLIFRYNPEHWDEIQNFAKLTLPNLESLLDGNGDTAIITNEQIDSLNTEIDWLLSVASPSLQIDIQKILELYPPNDFRGMTMSEALEYINEKFDETILEPQIVPNSNSKWAFYNFKDIYFEYPTNWYIQIKEESNSYLYLIPSKDSDEKWVTGTVVFEAWEIVDGSNQPFNLHREIDYIDVIWEQPITVQNMEGYYFVYDPTKTGLFRKIVSIFYHQEKNTKIRITVLLFEPEGMFFDLNMEENSKKYEYFFHLSESLKWLK